MSAKRKLLFAVVLIVVLVLSVWVLRELTKADTADYAYSVIQTSDGGYALAGLSGPSGFEYSAFWLVKTDASGNMQWSKTYGEYVDLVGSTIQTSDGGYALTGGVHLFTDESSFILVKTDAGGNMQWSKKYRGGHAGAYSVIQTGDGGYALAGDTIAYGAGSDDFWLIKTDAAGNVQWNRTYGFYGTERVGSMVQTSDGGYALTGKVTGGAFWLVKTGAEGDLQWDKAYGMGGVSGALSVVQTSDGGYALFGDLLHSLVGDAMWLVKTDAAGNAQWNKTYNKEVYGEAMRVIQTSDEGYALIGYHEDFVLIKTDSAGNTQWNKSYGGPNVENAHSVIQTSDGGYALAGHTYASGHGDFWLVKTDASGNMQWSKAFGRQRYTLPIPWFAYAGECTSSGSTRSFGSAKRTSEWLRLTQN